MRKAIRVIVVDPAAQTVAEQEELLTLERLHELTECETITSFRVDHRHIAYCDDNGFYRQPDANGCLPQTFFKRGNQPIVGPFVIVGTPHPMEDEGYETSCTLQVQQIEEAIARFALEPLGVAPEVKVYVPR
jgi:hypothetical protein